MHDRATRKRVIGAIDELRVLSLIIKRHDAESGNLIKTVSADRIVQPPATWSR
jgi:hypothetical protein